MIASQRRFAGKRRPTRQQAPQGVVSGVLTETAFLRAFARERLLANRHQRRFSLVVFRLPVGSLRPATDPQVVGILARHTRLRDVGRLGPSGIGVLLRGTAPEGACVFGVRVATELTKIGADVAWRIICHPEGGSPAGVSAPTLTQSSDWNRFRLR